MPHEEPPQEDLRLFDTAEAGPEIHVPPEHRIKPVTAPAHQGETLFDTGTPESVTPPTEHEAEEEPEVVRLPSPDDFEPYADYPWISSTQAARIENQVEAGTPRRLAEKGVLGKEVGEEAEEAPPQAPPRTTNHNPGREVQRTRVLRGRNKPKGSRGFDTADSDARIEQARRTDALSAEANERERAENTENPPQ